MNKDQNDKTRTADDLRNDPTKNDSSIAHIREYENLIDPGNEHRHDVDKEKDITDNRSKHEADVGGDGTGTIESKPE